MLDGDLELTVFVLITCEVFASVYFGNRDFFLIKHDLIVQKTIITVKESKTF